MVSPKPLLRAGRAFTLVELLTVIGIVVILVAFVLGISGHRSSGPSKAMAEMAAISSACESYKADHGWYPRQKAVLAGGTTATIPSDELDPRTMGDSASDARYFNASIELYEALSGDLALTGSSQKPGVQNYISGLRQYMYGRKNPDEPPSASNPITCLEDPFGDCYGYSTANATAMTTGTSPIPGYSPPTSAPGYNPTYDLWSTSGQTANPYSTTGHPAAGDPGDPQLQWKKNW